MGKFLEWVGDFEDDLGANIRLRKFVPWELKKFCWRGMMGILKLLKRDC